MKREQHSTKAGHPLHVVDGDIWRRKAPWIPVISPIKVRTADKPRNLVGDHGPITDCCLVYPTIERTWTNAYCSYNNAKVRIFIHINRERERGIYIYIIYTLCIYIYAYGIYTNHPSTISIPWARGSRGSRARFAGRPFGGISIAEEIRELPRTAPEKTGSRGDESCVNHGEIGWIWMDSWYILWILGL